MKKKKEMIKNYDDDGCISISFRIESGEWPFYLLRRGTENECVQVQKRPLEDPNKVEEDKKERRRCSLYPWNILMYPLWLAEWHDFKCNVLYELPTITFFDNSVLSPRINLQNDTTTSEIYKR